MISRRELIDIHDRLSAAEMALMLADDSAWRLPSVCNRRRTRMREAVRLLRFGVERRAVRRERMERKEA